MSIINQFKEKNPELVPSNKNSANYGDMENVAIKVTGYESNNYVLGDRLDTKQPVKAYLRPVNQNPQSKYKRPEIEDFAANKSKVSTPIGGIIKLEGCYVDNEGLLNARWAKQLKKDNTRDVMLCYAMVKYMKNNDNNDEYVQVVTVYPKKKIEFQSVEELKTLASMLELKTPGSKPFMTILMTDGEETEFVNIYPQKPTKTDDNDTPELPSGLQTIESFLQHERSAMLRNLINEKDVKCFAVPGRTIYPGSETREKLLEDNKGVRGVLETSFNINKDDRNKQAELGFLASIITVQYHEDGTPYIIDVAPIKSSDQPVSIKEFIQ